MPGEILADVYWPAHIAQHLLPITRRPLPVVGAGRRRGRARGYRLAWYSAASSKIATILVILIIGFT
ncbi:MAG: hypothetical protein ACKOUM_03080, partial [Sphingopyxis sp.]